jgi:ABC-type multidrug transport system fused ATPase/permease subunit
MKLLFKAALQHRKRFFLLIVAVFFMIFSTMGAKLEMLAFGAVTKSGPDFFALFSPDQNGRVETVDAITYQDMQEAFPKIAHDGQAITKADAIDYMARRENGNILNRFMSWGASQVDLSHNLLVLAAVLIVIALIKGVSLFGANYTRELVMIKVGRDLRQRYFEHLQTLSLDFYHQYNVGALSARISGDARTVAEAVYSGLIAYIQTPITVLVSLVLCFILSVEMSLIMFIFFPVLLFPAFYLAKKIKKIARRTLANSETYSSGLLDSLSGIQTIKLFAMEKFSIARFREQNNQMAHLAERGARIGFLSRPILHMMSTLLLAGIIVYGLYIARLTISEILVFCGLVYLMYDPVKRLSDENLKVQTGIAAAERLYEVLDLKPTVEDTPDAIELTDFRKSIEFRNVWFRYGEEWVVKNLSFTINKGEVVAFVGSTGAGKSTIAHLLPRLYDVQKGEILIDGKPLKAYTQTSIRELMGFVSQKPFLFLDTVAENISFGQNFTRQEIITAAKRAHAHEFIHSLEHGYDTPLKEGGKNLSGGQQQRLAIARALVKQAPILVMDEATSSLDAVSENNIKQAINELRGQVTQVLIAHRLSTIEDADKIIFLEYGEVIRQGTKDELLATCPPFKAMWDLMHRGAEVVS